MTCRLCRKEKKLIKAHVIPKWAFRFLYPSGGKIDGKLHMVDAKYPQARRRPVGVYDKSILCAECDQTIGRLYDEYAKKIFIDSKFIKDSQGKLIYSMRGIDSCKIKLFFVSLLWRASISGREEFEKIKLGPYENRFRKMILDKNCKSLSVEIILGKYDSEKFPNLVNKSIFLPRKARIKGGLNNYYVYLPRGIKTWVKIDQRRLTHPLDKVSLDISKGMIYFLKLGKYEQFGEFKRMADLVSKVPKSL